MKNNNYATELEKLLLSKKEYLLNNDGDKKELNKVKISHLARNFDKNLLILLKSNKTVGNQLFVSVANGVVAFKLDNFLTFINNREFLPNSYTVYKNKIGLGANKEDYLDNYQHIILNWPYKDCILEGGQDKEDQKRSEVFFNQALAPDEINRLLDDKVFTKWKRYDENGEHELDKLNDKDNLIIKGNNLIVLHSLLKRFAGKVKLIYIDPPYNTGNDGFNYNDRFNHSTWLTFMKNRLEIAKELLSDDGSIYVQMDVKEAHYLKVLMDEIFGIENFRSEIIWDTSIPYVAGNKWLSNNWIYSHSQIFYYSKHKGNEIFNKLTFNVQQPSGTISQKPYKDVWTDIKNFSGFLGAKDYKMDFNTRKPEKLIERIIKASSNAGDIVLDYHLGSGTTAVVAHKMGRQYIGIEQMDYLNTKTVPRLCSVVKGDDDKGISKSIGWTGGGSFVYTEVKNDTNSFCEKIKKTKNKNELEKLFEEVSKSSFLSYRINTKKLNINEFKKLNLNEQKGLLFELIDKNTLYVNYSDLENSDYNISDNEKKFNKSFYEVDNE